MDEVTDQPPREKKKKHGKDKMRIVFDGVIRSFKMNSMNHRKSTKLVDECTWMVDKHLII